jgi:hypothetical protein
VTAPDEPAGPRPYGPVPASGAEPQPAGSPEGPATQQSQPRGSGLGAVAGPGPAGAAGATGLGDTTEQGQPPGSGANPGAAGGSGLGGPAGDGGLGPEEHEARLDAWLRAKPPPGTWAPPGPSGPVPLAVPQRRPASRLRSLGVLAAVAVILTVSGVGQNARSGIPILQQLGLGRSSEHSYAFLHTTAAGEPVAYDPCSAIHYVVNHRTQTSGVDSTVTDAIAEVSRLTGLRFVSDSETDEIPRDDRPRSLPDRYGRGWAPVLIAWTDPAENPDLAGNIVGRGGSDTATIDGVEFNVTGVVALDGPEMADVRGRRNGAALTKAVVLHELGHLVGLDHVKDSTQLMNAENFALTDFGAGDRAGLALLGKGPCLPSRPR